MTGLINPYRFNAAPAGPAYTNLAFGDNTQPAYNPGTELVGQYIFAGKKYDARAIPTYQSGTRWTEIAYRFDGSGSSVGIWLGDYAPGNGETQVYWEFQNLMNGWIFDKLTGDFSILDSDTFELASQTSYSKSLNTAAGGLGYVVGVTKDSLGMTLTGDIAPISGTNSANRSPIYRLLGNDGSLSSYTAEVETASTAFGNLVVGATFVPA